MSKIKGPMASYIVEKIKKVFKKKNYAFFESGNYNLNIVGIRNESGSSKNFDDNIIVLYKNKSSWVVESYLVTTEPGPKILKTPLKSVQEKGTAILVPGQYRSVYKIDWHGSKDRGHIALCQRAGKVKVWRDNNRDIKPDYHGAEDEGWYGINIHKHRGSVNRVSVGGVSAGCQVFQSNKEFSSFMKTCNLSKDSWGNSFTYTLIEEKDLN